MAKATETKSTEAAEPAALAVTDYLEEAPTVKEVTLYDRDGNSRKLTDPSAIVRAKFTGWSATKPKK